MANLIIYNTLLLVQTEPEVGEKAREFLQNDPYGGVMAIIAMSVVFLSLLIMYQLLALVSKLVNRKYTFFKKKDHSAQDEVVSGPKIPVSGEINAAIAMALHLYRAKLHDMESFRLTINRVSRSYSPWSSKIYSLRKSPERYYKK